MARIPAGIKKCRLFKKRLSHKQSMIRVRKGLRTESHAVKSRANFEKDPETNLDPHSNQNTKASSDIEIELQDQVEQDPKTNRSARQAHNTGNDAVCGEEVQIEGRHIVDISYMLNQIHDKFDNHSQNLNCSFRDVIQKKSHRYGLQTQIFFECRVCKFQDSIWTDRNDDDTMSINRCAVAGTMATGIGYLQLEQLLASVSVPCMAPTTYMKYQMEMVAAFDEAALNEMLRAGEIAKKMPMEKGDFIIHEGQKIPFITVVADCAWMKRSYKTGKYNSLSGVGAIVDQHTGKAIYIGVRNKFCSVCEWATRHNVETKPHVCFKNWGRDQASTGMEADALLDGFKTSMEMHGLIYKTLIADGDSNVYKSILDNDPYGKYGVVVEKKECVNHLLRNLSRKIKDVAKTKGRNISRLKKLVDGSVLKFRNSIEMAIAHRRKDLGNNPVDQIQIDLLKKDVTNTPYHVFGDHRECNKLQGFCAEQTTDEGLNLIDDLRKAGLLDQLQNAMTYLAIHSDSLLYHANNNAAEAFNSIVCKSIGGKRINFGMRGSFQARCAGSVLQYNTQNILTKLHQSEGKKPPTAVTSLEAQRQRKVANNSRSRQRRKLSRTLSPEKSHKQSGRDNNYGPNAEKPDMPDCVYDDLVLVQRRRLLEQQENRAEIEKNTRGQVDNALWKAARSKLLTASNFGKVCRMHDTTSCSATVKAILYPSVKSTPAMVWGRTNESKAIEALTNKLAEEGNAVTIRPCGLFIDRELEFLGASPDGIINDTSIVEVKCPTSAQNYHPEDAIEQRVTVVPKYFDNNDCTKMNTAHHYYYQVQGQLHITQADICYFAVWTPLGLKYIKVPRDDEFWTRQMEPHLTRFYKECMLPEIIDGRYSRRMPIRDPEYILEARRSKIRVAEASQARSHVHSGGVAVSNTAVTSEEDDGESPSAHMQAKQPYNLEIDSTDLDQAQSPGSVRESETYRDEIRRVAPLKLIRTDQRDSDSWIVTSSDEYCSGSERTVPLLKLVKRRAENGSRWAVSSSDEQCSSGDKARIPPLKLIKVRTELGSSWVLSSADEQELDYQRQVPMSLNKQTDMLLTSRPPPPTELSEARDNGPWVVITDDCVTNSPSKAEIELLESINKNVPIAEVRGDILSKDSLLNDTSIDQFLSVVKETSEFNTATSLWLSHPRFIKPSCSASQDIHIIGGNAFRHWRCLHFDRTQLFVYDSLGCAGYQSLKAEEIKFIFLRYPDLKTEHVVFPTVQKQLDGSSCGVFAAAFATTVALGGNPVHAIYSKDVMKLRSHLLEIIQNKVLSAFPSA